MLSEKRINQLDKLSSVISDNKMVPFYAGILINVYFFSPFLDSFATNCQE